MGSEFNQRFSMFVYRPTITVSYGYLNYFAEFYPSAQSSIDATLLDRMKEMLDYLRDKYLSVQDSFIQTIEPLVER